MKQEIVKVQLPLAYSGGEATCLIYNEDKSIMQEFPIPPGAKFRKMMNKDEGKYYNGLKQFFYAHTDTKTKMLVLDDVAPWQEW